MTNSIYETYETEMEKIKKSSNTIAIFLVGSSKGLDLRETNLRLNDIDIFVFVNQGEIQERVIKYINGIEFDINYFSRNGLKYLVNNKEYFFLKEMKDAQVVYDKNNTAIHIKELCRRSYLEGPKKLSESEKQFIKIDVESKVSRLKYKEKFENFEYKFLTNLYLKDIIIGYFKINDKWVPKDKNLLKELKKENKELFNFIEEIHEKYDYSLLLQLYNHIFKEIKYTKSIKITYS